MRLFVAFDLPPEVRRELGALCAGVPGAKWVAPERMHVTLRFIGEVDGLRFEDVCEALAEVSGGPFEARLHGVGQFGNRREPHVLWAGVEAGPELPLLQRRIETALQGAGLEPEGRKFHAHVTLARLRGAPRGRVGDFLARNGLFATPPFTVDSFVLYSSFLSREGAIYRPEATYPL